MKKLALILLLIFIQSSVFASPVVFNEDGKFGLRDEAGSVIVEPQYKKLIRLGDTGWIIQKGSRFGIMSDSGKILVDTKYNYAERVLGKFAKLKKGDKYGLFDEMGFEILQVDYSSIDLLFGGMFLTCRNYKYGVVDMNGQQFEIESTKGEELTLPSDIRSLSDNSNFAIKELISKPGVTTGYYSVTATNYFLKLFSSISPAYEETIDELMFSQGADAAGVIMKFSWVPKFPFVYAKKYWRNLTAPNNGPLSGVKSNLKKELTE